MAEKAGYKHFMLKEIFEQPIAVKETVLGRASLESGRMFLNEIEIPDQALREVERIVILACGTSWHSALVGKFLFESLARVPVDVDYGSEYRYRDPIVSKNTLAVVITQSGETADTLAALREARKKGALSISICNVVGSMATRETDGTVYTHAGPEIGVASTKAFTTQIVALHLLAMYLGQIRGTLTAEAARPHIEGLTQMPLLLEHTLKCEPLTEEIARRFYQRSDFLYLGRGINYPIALEGALKLKEISYIHAEGYPAGEMKHGPIALIDEQMPVVTIAPDDHVFEKMIGNIQEAKARGGSVIALTTEGHKSIRDLLDPTQDFLIEVPQIAPAADACADGDPAAAARVPHRGAARLRRRSAEEPGEERHGRVEARAGRTDAVQARGARRRGEECCFDFCRHLAGSDPLLRAVDQICRPHALAQHRANRVFDRARFGLERERMPEQHRGRADRPDRIGDVPARRCPGQSRAPARTVRGRRRDSRTEEARAIRRSRRLRRTGCPRTGSP